MIDVAPISPEPAQGQVEKPAGLGALLQRLTEPAASIQEPERRRRARLLAALLASIFLMGLLSTVVVLFPDQEPNDLYVVVGGTLIIAVAYGLSRTRYYNLAALLMVATVSGAVFAGEVLNPDPGKLYFLIMGVLVSSLFLSWRATSLIMLATILGIGLLGATLAALPVRDVIGAMLAVLCVGALGIIGIIIRQQDLEEIQRQSISLRQSEDRFRLVSYATNDVVWDWDLSTGKVWRNQGARRLFGFPEDQIMPVMSWWEAQIHPDEREKIAGSLRAAIDGSETFWSMEYRFRRADESYIDVFDRAYIIDDEKSGKPVRVLGAIMDITLRKQAEEVLREESVHDPLTGLFNRRYMEEMFEREISRAERAQQKISIIMLDVDQFKQVNDTLGHAAGDTLLHKLGVFLLTHVRGADIACRYGGDEFILILPGAPLEVARQRAEIICQAARELIIEPYHDSIGKFTLSLGVAVFPEQGSSRKDILATAADAALYAAKEAGRNRVAVAKGNSD